ncbi:hypothetical protein [Aquincola tertiaricarbonis]|uniref:hypothetical protein n=1 Tax=Aquincola tertiaricarbonis TaxID=391953 RepID=UPI001E49F35A|nr:hypothetical protein [Aquincola tertiaricarbonis]
MAQTTGVDAKQVKAVLAGLKATMLAPLHIKGLREFTLPGLLKVTAVAVPALKTRGHQPVHQTGADVCCNAGDDKNCACAHSRG